jgi:hypothetical protein
MLQARLIQVNLTLNRSPGHAVGLHDVDSQILLDPEIEQQLQAHGFHFTELQGISESPDTASMGSEVQRASPQSTLPSGRQLDQHSPSNFGSTLKMPSSTSSHQQALDTLTHHGGTAAGMDYMDQDDFTGLFTGMTYDYGNVAGRVGLFESPKP